MATLAELQARLEKLEKARASGAKTVAYDNNKMVTFRDVDDLNKAIAAVKSDIAAAGGTKVRRAYTFTTDKGL